MLEHALTTERCQQIIEQLVSRRGWTIARTARVIRAPVEYVQRIRAGKQSFQLGDVEAIAKATKQPVYRLILGSIQRGKLSPELRGLHDLAAEEAASHERLTRAWTRKGTKKRRARARAA